MIKRFLTAFVLLIFCIEPCVYAGEIIIIDSNGNAKYEKDINNPKIQQEIKDSKVTVNINPITDAPTDSTIEKEHQKCIKKAEKVFSDYVGFKYSRDGANIKLNLLDGDYAEWNESKDHLWEYHSDKSTMGFVKIDKKIFKKNKKSIVFYEYRIGYNTKNKGDSGLKHILFLDYDKNKNLISQYIYDVNGKLLCKQINNDIYVAPDARNMLPRWSDKVEIQRFNKAGAIAQTAMVAPLFIVGGALVVGIGLPLAIIVTLCGGEIFPSGPH